METGFACSDRSGACISTKWQTNCTTQKKTQEDYERDVKMPSIERAMEIARYFGCPLSWILGEGDTFAYESTTDGFMRDVNNGFNALTSEIAALRTDLARKEG